MKKYMFLALCLVSLLSLFCSCKKNKFDVTIIYEDGTKEIITEIKKGSKITEPNFNLPIEVNDIQYVDESGNKFSFDTEIMSDLTIYANFVYNQYTVNFYDYDGTLIDSYTLKYGSEVIFPNNPTREAEIGCTYEFKDWTLSDTIVTKNLDFKAQYTKILEEYTINFYDYDNTLIKSYILQYGSEIIFPDEPTRDGGVGYSYEFKDWTLTDTIVTKNLDFKAQYTQVFEEYTVNFYDYDKTLITTYTLPYGSEVIFPENPTRDGGVGYSYVFKDWTIKQTVVTKDLTFTARYTKVYDEMTVTALNLDGSVYTIEKCDYDSYINTIEEPKFDKDPNKYYRFYGWYDTETEELFDFDKEVIKNTTIYPKYDIYDYEETTLENATISFIGDSISTFYDKNSSVNSLYGGTNQFYYPIYSTTVKSVELTWWHQTYTKLGLKLGVNNSWSGSAAYGNGNSAGMSEYRLKTLGDNGTPNIVVIFLGTNDNVNGHTVTNLETAYIKMIEYISKNYIDFSNNTAKIPYIYLFTNGYSAYSGYNYTEERRLEYNEMFKKLANTYSNVRIFDLAKYITSDNYSSYLGDSLHYNADGMKLISDKLVEQLTNDFSKTKKVQKQRQSISKVIFYLEKDEKNYYKKEGEYIC
ncbi:MAG: SGNH/GDSL hydrolase family protein [Erysipelotrichaceae bacterium]|nr:SGNH/GDSL hydrolase family protein [Erysipelotrichaceae bacterium]